MAGVRQHYLPQFLQRGFAGADGFVWFFRKDNRGRCVSTRNVGVERTFYTNGNDTRVDDAITAAEAEFAQSVRELRNARSGPVDAQSLPRLFAHLEIRTRHLRQSFQQTTESLHRKALSILTDDQKLERMLVTHIAKNPEKIDEMARHELRRLGLPESSSPAIIHEMTTRLSEFLGELRPEIHRASTNIASALPETLRHSIKDAHNEALGKTIAPEIRVHNYEKLSFRTIDVPSASMILGDCGAVFHVDGAKQFKTITENNDTILAAILPITPTRVLVGASESYRPNAEDIRVGIARCSLEFFIAAEDSDENASLAKLIGSDALLLTDTELNDILGEASS
jgi:Protein of unknown function (DUF4238)